MRMVPVGAGIPDNKVIGKTATDRNRILGNAGDTIHIVGNAQAVPVDTGGIREVIGKVHDDTIANLRSNQWTGKRSAIGPHRRAGTRDNFHVGYPGFQFDFQHIRVGV